MRKLIGVFFKDKDMHLIEERYVEANKSIKAIEVFTEHEYLTIMLWTNHAVFTSLQKLHFKYLLYNYLLNKKCYISENSKLTQNSGSNCLKFMLPSISLDKQIDLIIKFLDIIFNKPDKTVTSKQITLLRQKLRLLYSSPGKRVDIPKKLRFEVLKHGGYRCKLCGRNAEDKVKLEIDHIVPLAKGGTSNFKNLQILCKECNIGKKANYE